jgi:hypothetical protein
MKFINVESSSSHSSIKKYWYQVFAYEIYSPMELLGFIKPHEYENYQEGMDSSHRYGRILFVIHVIRELKRGKF